MTITPPRKRPIRNTWLLVAALIVVLIIILLFAARSVNTFVAGRGSVVPLQPWMTIPYIARINNISPAPLYSALGLPPAVRDQRPIGGIARAQNRPVGTLIASLEQTIASVRATNVAATSSPP